MTEGLARTYAPMAGVAAAVLVADQLSKAWADDLTTCAELAGQGRRPTVGFCLAYNEGMAFSVGWGSGAIIALVAVAIVVVLVVAARKVPFRLRLLMGAVAGGALGNVIDRAVRDPAPLGTNRPASDGGFMSGAVIDFVYTRFWATFNVADACIVVGGILLSIALWRMPDPAPTFDAGLGEGSGDVASDDASSGPDAGDDPRPETEPLAT